jgi:hypothetical protein
LPGNKKEINNFVLCPRDFAEEGSKKGTGGDLRFDYFPRI